MATRVGAGPGRRLFSPLKDIDDYVKGVVAALLTDQVNDKAGLAAKIGWAAFAVCAIVAVMGQGVGFGMT